MTIHDRLKEILHSYVDEMHQHTPAISPDPTPDTIAAIISAFEERLPGNKEYSDMDHLVDTYQKFGWNAYREEVRKVLEEKL